MQTDLALDVLGDVMGWDLDRCRTEYAWLELMASYKYDDYRDFIAGIRFFESLADWIQQFPQESREAAYRFLKQRLIFFSASEMQHLVELLYPDFVRPRILEDVAKTVSLPAYRVWSRPENETLATQYRRQTLFFGLSDGARFDTFRRSTTGLISNEQVMLATEISAGKWRSVLEKLRKDLKDDESRFRSIFLIDDFNATGTTLSGKLDRFWENFQSARVGDTHMSDDWTLHVHHYITTADALARVRAEQDNDPNQRGAGTPKISFTYSVMLSDDLKVTQSNSGEFWYLIQNFYNSSIETEHTRKGGYKDVKLGFGYCALPLIFEHNTPNNTLPLLWAETSDANGEHAMRPLFRRRQRHTELGNG